MVGRPFERCAAAALILTALDVSVLPARDRVNAQLPWHEPVLDSQGRLLAWYEPDNERGYDKVLYLGWDFIEHKVPNDTRTHAGLKIYLINSLYDDQTLQGANWQHNPAMVYGSFIDSLAGWYPYSGDEKTIQAVQGMLDYELAHGTTRLTGTGATSPSPPPATTRRSTAAAFRTCRENSTAESRPTSWANSAPAARCSMK